MNDFLLFVIEDTAYVFILSFSPTSYQSLEHTRINIMKTLITDSIDAEEEFATRKLKLVQKLRRNIECIDARKDVEYFIKSNISPPQGSWSNVSGNIAQVISTDLVSNEALSGNSFFNSPLSPDLRSRLRSQHPRPDSLQVHKHDSIEKSESGISVTKSTEQQLSLSWKQFHIQVNNEHTLINQPDLSSNVATGLATVDGDDGRFNGT
jgi:hypothetical protein